jgi:hypothetical protein
MITYVAHVSGTKDSVTYCVEQYISIAMSKESQRMFYTNATKPQFAAFHQLVDIISESYAYVHIL